MKLFMPDDSSVVIKLEGIIVCADGGSKQEIIPGSPFVTMGKVTVKRIKMYFNSV